MGHITHSLRQHQQFTLFPVVYDIKTITMKLEEFLLDFFSTLRNKSMAYLGPCQAITMEFLCETGCW